MPMEFPIIRAFVLSLLQNPLSFDLGFASSWSLQGFGMLRIYLSQTLRLHVWSPHFRIPNVSDAHDHPWDFESLIVSGQMQNQRYHEIGTVTENSMQFKKTTIVCGTEAVMVDPPSDVRLIAAAPEVYGIGTSYRQHACEIHNSTPLPGTVTIIRRTFVKADTEHAKVYWQGGEWVNAKPRPATAREIREICGDALSLWRHQWDLKYTQNETSGPLKR